MASYNELNALIDAYINRNGVQAITGQILNGVLKAMVEQLGRGYTIMGAAIPTTDPGTPDGPECYFASETGTYTDFDGLQVAPGELALLCYTPSDGWTKATIYEGFQEVGATIDGNVGTPSVGVSYADGVLSFDFHNMKGNPGQNGQDGAAAGFGTIGADITGGVGTPGVSVESSGPATAKNLQLKGETGVTSVVATVDNTSGTPSCQVSLVGQQLTLSFSGLKGLKGDTGVSADYPITIYNGLDSDATDAALAAAQGKVLQGEITELEAKVDDLSTGKYYGYFAQEEDLPEADVDGFAYVGQNSPYTIYNLRGGVWTSSDITVNQSPIGNDEDIDQDEDGKLQFANRVYNAQQPNGMGYKILRKDATFASQVTETNTIYEIRYDFDLGGTAFSIPSGCYFQFNGGKLKNTNFSGSVLNEELKPEWFGAAADGVTDDASPLSQCINLAIASDARVSLEKDKTYAVKTEIDFSISEKNAFINGNGATIQVTSPGYIQIQNARYAQVQCPHNLVRGGASITFSSMPAGLKYGDIINISSSEVGETSYNTKKQQTTRVGKIDGNTIYLADTLLMDYTASAATISFYKPARVEMRNIKVMCNRGSLNASMRMDYIIPFFDGVEIDGNINTSYGIVLHGCQDGVIKNGTNSFITYGYLVNACAHLVFDNIFCPSLATHPVAIATFSNYICVRRLTGVGQLIESHTGFNITYEDCVFGASASAGWNMRAVGFTLRRCRIFSIDGTNPTALIGSVALYDYTIYYDYTARFEDCEFPMDEIDVYNAGLIEFIGCKFLPDARIRFGVSSTSIVRKGRIIRSENVKKVSFHTYTFALETDMEEFDAVKNNDGEYEISLATASFNLEEGNGEWRGHGKINGFDISGSLAFPIKLYPQRSDFASGSDELYITLDFDLYSTNRAGDHPYAKKTYRMECWYYPKYNDGALQRFVDLTPEETRVTATISDFSFSGTGTSPESQVVSFNLNMSSQITSFGAARNTVVYDCKVVGRRW